MSVVKSFLSNYFRTLLAFSLTCSIFYYPVIVSYLDCFKEESALQERTVSIISAQTDRHPNVEASLSDGSIEYFDFPSTFSGIRSWGPAFIGKVNEKKLKEMIGQNVLLQVSSTRYALFEPTLKIWAIHANGLDLSFKDISEAHRKFYFSTGNILFNVVGIMFSIFLMGIVIYADLRDRQSSFSSKEM